ncbi:MAG: 5-(carboxyamino)imidazole ribonucleotide mutase [Candidatus Coatesbacteria bacterium]|nr:MAG: 5-(carboxyamino)imidazole ribonucleotide mutase [Candidatus Coatesbacteria bacterium]
MAKVGVVIGSDSDYDVMKITLAVLDELGIESEFRVASAHRTPDVVREFGEGAEKRGVEVIIAGAGMAAHLAGVIAAHTTLPVIAVPLPSGALDGLDALLSSVQMPGGIPVAVVAVGKAGAVNAAVLAAEILGLKYPETKEAIIEYRRARAAKVAEKDAELEKKVKGNPAE